MAPLEGAGSAGSSPGGGFGAVARTVRWVVRGLGAELAANVLQGRAQAPPLDGSTGRGQLAVVTGATGGIGAEVCRGLAERGFEVCVAARDPRTGEALAEGIRARGGSAFFQQVVLDERPTDLARALRRRPVSLLVNNAATMGGEVGNTLRVNLCAPAALTLALLPSLRAGGAGGAGGRVVNVASSSHLRADAVSLRVDDSSRDSSLNAYGQSKLGLMHVSLLLRRACSAPGGPSRVTVHDCHPGLVWTPMLRHQLGAPLCRALEWSGVRRRLFRSPEQGAATVLCAALAPPPEHRSPPAAAAEAGSEYFVNGRRDAGAASGESRDWAAAQRTWRWLVEAEPSLPALAARAGVHHAFTGL